MRTSIGLGGVVTGRTGDLSWQQVVDWVTECERLGVDDVWSAEAWGMDAVSTLAYIGARTTTMRLGTGIMQISARSPVMTAMTALTMDTMTGGRFLLGLGVSGPQVVEGFHGVRFAKPLSRLRECVDVVKQAIEGEKIDYHGEHYEFPLAGGQGKSLRLAMPPKPGIPIYLATIAPKALEYTGAVADGWVGTSFTPDHAEAMITHIKNGAEAAGRSLDDIDLQAGGTIAFGDPEEIVPRYKPGIAFSLGAMGSPTTNFYNDAYKRAGYTDACTEVQRLWVEGKREEAAERVPDEMVLETNLIGDDTMVTERLTAYRDAGIDTLRIDASGRGLDERLETIGRAMDLIRAL